MLELEQPIFWWRREDVGIGTTSKAPKKYKVRDRASLPFRFVRNIKELKKRNKEFRRSLCRVAYIGTTHFNKDQSSSNEWGQEYLKV